MSKSKEEPEASSTWNHCQGLPGKESSNLSSTPIQNTKAIIGGVKWVEGGEGVGRKVGKPG